MEELPTTTRGSNLQQSRAGKFLQKVSGFRGRIRFPGRRPKHPGETTDDIGPYLRQTRSMDTNMMAKPYMSQPLLGLHNMDLRDNDDNEDSERSASPADSSSRAGTVYAPQRDKPLPRLSLGDIDGLPSTTGRPQYVTSLSSPGSIAPPPVPPKPAQRPHSEIVTPSAGIPGRFITRKQSKSKVSDGMLPTLQTTPSPDAMAKVIGPSASKRPELRLDNLPTTPHRGVNILSDAASYGTARLSPTIIARHPPLPILNLPKLVVSSPESSSQPTLLPVASGSSAHPQVDAARRNDLRSMPALPLRGQDEPRDGDDDGDSDGEDMDDDDDDEFHDAEDDHDHDSSHEDGEDGSETPMRRPRGSMDSIISGFSSGHTTPDLGTSSRYRYGTHLLPEVDTSRIDLSVFTGTTVEPTNPSNKGKGKRRETWRPNTSQTPTQSRLDDDDYFSANPRHSLHSTQASHSALRTPRTERSFKAIHDNDQTPRPGIYKHTSRSMIDLVGIANRNKPIREATNESESFSAEEASQRPDTIKGKNREQDDARSNSRPGTHTDDRRNPSPNRETLSPPHPLQRRRSMPTFTSSTEPPPYPAFPPHPHHRPLAPPRDDVAEGSEPLPPYSNGIYLKAVMPRKMEFTKPGIMARDRKWRRVVCELEGTVFRVYRCPPELAGVSVIGGWWERKVGVGDVAETGGAVKAGGNSGISTRLRREEDKELLRVAKAEDEAASARVQTQVQVALPPDTNIQLRQSYTTPTETDFHPDFPPSQAPSTISSTSSSKSRLGVVSQLLKPRSHSRSQSDVSNSLLSRSASNTPRSSLSLARPSTSSGSVSGSSPNPIEGSAMVTIPSASSSRSHFRHGSSSNSVFKGQLVADGSQQELRTSELNLIKAYTLQHAESGLGNDYVKRRNVIRVRMEGEQFLIQARDMTDVVAWIEGFQAASNIALDLDERVMPRGPLFPRRRRRRRREGANQPHGPGNNTSDA